MTNRKRIDDKNVRKFLFGRKSPIDSRPIFVSVEAFDKDHAIKRLREKFAWVEVLEWDYIDELDPDHFIGGLGEDLPLHHAPMILPASRRIQ